jgi:DNA-binding transcriptional ArsR family regulator
METRPGFGVIARVDDRSNAVVDEEVYRTVDVAVADVAKAMAHPARVAILRTLARRSCICGELVDELPLAQATVSQHLKVLRSAGLISGTVDGPRSCYQLDRAGLSRARSLLGPLLRELEESPACC